ncbi:MAG TPA: DUF1801 domain-containing protein [Rhodoferax sp.]
MSAAKTQQSSTKRLPKSTPSADAGTSASELIDARIEALQDWRGELLAELRALILKTDAEIVEEWKWNTPVWSCHGIVCTGETYKKAVKLTFAKGAQVEDPSRLFNASLDGKVRRAIDFPDGGRFDTAALTALLRAATALNRSAASSKPIGSD